MSRGQLALMLTLLALLPATALPHPTPDTTQKHYDKLVAAAPEDYRPRLERANFLIREHHFAAAATDIAAVERLTPKINTGYLQGILAMHSGDIPLSVEQFSRFIAEFPEHPQARAERGHARLMQGDKSLALQDLVSAVKLQHPVNPGLVLETAALARELKDIPLALALAERAIAESGKTPQLQLFVVDTLDAAGRHGEALIKLEQLLAQSPDNPEWQIRRARLLLSTHQPDKAEAVLAATEEQLSARKATPWRNRTLATIQTMRAQLILKQK